MFSVGLKPVSLDKIDNAMSGRKPKLEIGQSTSQGKKTRSSAMSVYLSSDEVTLSDKKSGLSSVYRSSEEYYEYKCDPCETAGDHTEAEGFCSDCDEYLCSTCFSKHSRSKASKYHVLLRKDDMPKNIITRQHVIVKEEAIFEVDHDVSSSITIMKVKGGMTSGVNTNEEYTFNRDINVKSDTDKKDCFIIDMTLVSENKLVLCDYDNQCLKLVDISKNIIRDILALPSKVRGITTISQDQIAVVLENCYKIQLVKVREKLTLDRSIKTNGSCIDVKMINNQLYVSCEQPVKFQILQQTGAIIKTIKLDDEILKHCKSPHHIAVSHDGSVIYVSDWKTNTVMSFDINGNMLSLYQGELVKPSGIITSPSGSVYVCNRDQNIVYKMTSDLTEAMVILGPGDGLLFPDAICLNKINQHLYISSANNQAKYRNTLKVYKC